MTDWICRVCGVEQRPGDDPPASCPICTDERQYTWPTGPSWTTAEELLGSGHRVLVSEIEPGLWGLRAEPKVGIGQTALLATTPQGNVLFDVPPFVDPDAVATVLGLGELRAIVASHPHMYGSQVEWGRACGGVPVQVAAKDERWVQRTGPSIVTWQDAFEPVEGVRLRQVGGHFPGQTIAHWSAPDGATVLLAGDACSVRPDGNVTFLRSYPNAIPLSPLGVRRIVAGLASAGYQRLYDNFASALPRDAQAIVEFSAARYLDWIEGRHDDLI